MPIVSSEIAQTWPQADGSIHALLKMTDGQGKTYQILGAYAAGTNLTTVLSNAVAQQNAVFVVNEFQGMVGSV